MTALSRTGARRGYFKTTTPEELLGVEVLLTFSFFVIVPVHTYETVSFFL